MGFPNRGLPGNARLQLMLKAEPPTTTAVEKVKGKTVLSNTFSARDRRILEESKNAILRTARCLYEK